MQVHVPWLHNCYITLQVYDAVSEATSSIGEIIKSLCTSNKERHHDSLSTIQSLLQVCTYIVCNGKNKSLLKKGTVSIQYICWCSLVQDYFPCLLIYNSSSIGRINYRHIKHIILHIHVWHRYPELNCFWYIKASYIKLPSWFSW